MNQQILYETQYGMSGESLQTFFYVVSYVLSLWQLLNGNLAYRGYIIQEHVQLQRKLEVLVA